MENDTKNLASVERQRDGRFNLYVPRQSGEAADTRSYRGQFESFGAAADYSFHTFGLPVPLSALSSA